MRDIDKEQPMIKRYLLGRLDEDDRRRFEEQFITDSEFREVALIVEDELIEDYLAELLPADERASFDSHYLSAPRQIQEFTLARALRDYALWGEATEPLSAAKEPEHKTHERGRRWLPVFASVALVLIVLAVSWSVRKWRWGGDQRLALNAEVSALNRQPYGEEPAISMTITSALSRDSQQGQKVPVLDRMDVVELKLKIPTQQYQSYQATLRVHGGTDVFTVGDLKAEETEEGSIVKLRMPARLLSAEDYILSLSGSTADSQLEGVADYFFRVVK